MTKPVDPAAIEAPSYHDMEVNGFLSDPTRLLVTLLYANGTATRFVATTGQLIALATELVAQVQMREELAAEQRQRAN